MGNRLWTIHFIRICIANFLLFISLYMLFPVVPAEMADRLGAPVSQTGAMFLLLTLGMFAIGPFHAYLVDAYKRKYVCAFSFAVMIAATAGYGFVNDITQLLLLCLVQGIAFGMATTAGYYRYPFAQFGQCRFCVGCTDRDAGRYCIRSGDLSMV